MKTLFKFTFIIFFVLSAWIQSTFAKNGGFYVGNGGDIINCAKGYRYGITKPYALDYYLANPHMKHDFPLANVSSFSASMGRIEKNISKGIPSALDSLREFRSLILSTDKTKKYYWERSFDLPDVLDEGKYIFPENCWDEYHSPGIIEQAIIRKFVSSEKNKIKFQYDGYLILKLRSSSPLQFSFLMIHEWLRNFTNNPETIRKVNYYLHSKKFDTDTLDEVSNQLEAFNLKIQ